MRAYLIMSAKCVELHELVHISFFDADATDFKCVRIAFV